MEKSLEKLLALHAEIDEQAHLLEIAHADRLECKRGCSQCCVDDLRVFRIEANRISSLASEVLQTEPHPQGACAFLDSEGACRIYQHRPYVCRTQGLPLRWFDDAGMVEMRDICEKNENGPEIITLGAEQCWTIGPFEGRLASLQRESHSDMERVRLRDLFRPRRE